LVILWLKPSLRSHQYCRPEEDYEEGRTDVEKINSNNQHGYSISALVANLINMMMQHLLSTYIRVNIAKWLRGWACSHISWGEF
jgi:hypothetical protein